jgi:hypothetical protein
MTKLSRGPASAGADHFSTTTFLYLPMAVAMRTQQSKIDKSAHILLLFDLRWINLSRFGRYWRKRCVEAKARTEDKFLIITSQFTGQSILSM